MPSKEAAREKEMEERDSLRMLGLMFILTANKGEARDVRSATVSVNGYLLDRIIEKYADEAEKILAGVIIPPLPDATPPQTRAKKEQSKKERPEFGPFANDCHLRDIDPKYCTCYKHKDNAKGRALCGVDGCPLFGESLVTAKTDVELPQM